MFSPPVKRHEPKGRTGQAARAGSQPRRPGWPTVEPGEPAAASWIQAKLELGTVDDPLEKEADRVAADITRSGGPEPPVHAARPQISRAGPKSCAEPIRHPLGGTGTPVSPESFQGRGEALPTPTRKYFEARLDHDFSAVRLHRGANAVASAHILGARAYTRGSDIVMGAGAGSSGITRANPLLAHELVHVVQQNGGQGLVQRSPLSDKVKADFAKDPTVNGLLARLSQADVQGDQADKDVDAEIGRLLSNRPDDIWLALRIRSGELGRTTGERGKKDAAGRPISRPIKVVFIRGSTDRRALVIAGVHGSEVQGIEIANMLIADLQGQKPHFTTIIVPTLFPDSESRRSREGDTPGLPDIPTNRNFPDPAQGPAAARATVDARGRPILPENLLLLGLTEKFQPERIISIHGTFLAGEAGIFYDRRELRRDEVKSAMDFASQGAPYPKSPFYQDEPGWEERWQVRFEALARTKLADLSTQAEDTDRELALKAARKIDVDTTSIKTLAAGRDFVRESEAAPIGKLEREAKGETDATKKQEKLDKAKALRRAAQAQAAKERGQNPSIAGHIVMKGGKPAIEKATWGGGMGQGVSLGGYAPKLGMSVFTVEPPLNFTSDDYASGKANDTIKTKADRITELKAYADAIRTILLGAP